MATPVIENGSFKVISSSTVVRTGPWQMVGLFVSSATSTPTIEILNATTSGTGTCVPVFTPIAASWYPLPISGGNGITVLVGGTVQAALSWNPQPGVSGT